MSDLLLDAMLGRLATYLRMCGYDTAYALDVGIETDGEILAYSQRTDRRLLTRDRELAARAADAVLLHSREIDDQLQELAAAGFDLTPSATPEYCGVCNGPLTAVPSDAQTPAYAPDPATEQLWRCEDCGQFFWKGSHWEDVATRLAGVD